MKPHTNETSNAQVRLINHQPELPVWNMIIRSQTGVTTYKQWLMTIARLLHEILT
jgi:hypothetical protein